MGGVCGSKDTESPAAQHSPEDSAGVAATKVAAFETMFGQELQTKDGMKRTRDVLNGKKAVLVYFSAHWCPPCRGFTPTLSQAYSAYKQGDVEVVFVSSDRDQASFNEYYKDMPWTALPFSNRDAKDSLAKKFGVQGIPMLVVLDADGNVVKDNGRGDVGSSADLAKALQSWGL